MSDNNLCYYNTVFGNIQPNRNTRNYREELLREQFIRLNKVTNVRYKNSSKTNL